MCIILCVCVCVCVCVCACVCVCVRVCVCVCVLRVHAYYIVEWLYCSLLSNSEYMYIANGQIIGTTFVIAIWY